MTAISIPVPPVRALPIALKRNAADCSSYLPPHFTVDENRDIYSVFGELHLALGYDIDMQVSLRYEDYGGGHRQQPGPESRLALAPVGQPGPAGFSRPPPSADRH